MLPIDRIRNFSIISHVDHGKSTLSDRILELTGAVDPRQMREQYLDSMDIERERGITIKAQNVRVPWSDHTLHLIDTPGHVDFGYEVSRSLAACEGAVLLVDASQGIQAQTLANCYQALENDLEIVAVLNKIDLPAADPERCAAEIEHVLGLPADEILHISAKTGEGVPELLDAIVARIPAPTGDPDGPAAGAHLRLGLRPVPGGGQLHPGRWTARCTPTRPAPLHAGRRQPRDRGDRRAHAGDGARSTSSAPARSATSSPASRTSAGPAPARRSPTATHPAADAARRLPRPQAHGVLRAVPHRRRRAARPARRPREAAAQRRQLHLRARVVHGRSGFGFRCGFLGLLHMEIVRERLEREFDLSLIATAPSVAYRAFLTNGTEVDVDNPSELPEPAALDHVDEPMLRATILTPAEYTGTIMELCQGKRAEMVKMDYLSPERVEFVYVIPLAEVVINFFDQLKSRTKGYASLDYEPGGLRHRRPGQGRPADQPRAGRRLLHHRAQVAGRLLRPADDREAARSSSPARCSTSPSRPPSAAGSLARETVKARRKDVLAKCYGGDITRKRKLLEKQKEGKKKMKNIGRVEVPQEAFVSALKLDD